MPLSRCYDTPSATGTTIKIKAAERFMWSQRSAGVDATACLRAPVLSARREGSRVQRSASARGLFPADGFSNQRAPWIHKIPAWIRNSTPGCVTASKAAARRQRQRPGRDVVRHNCPAFAPCSPRMKSAASFSGSSLQPEPCSRLHVTFLVAMEALLRFSPNCVNGGESLL